MGNGVPEGEAKKKSPYEGSDRMGRSSKVRGGGGNTVSRPPGDRRCHLKWEKGAVLGEPHLKCVCEPHHHELFEGETRLEIG